MNTAAEGTNIPVAGKPFRGLATPRHSLGTYQVTMTDEGSWLHPDGSDFLFAYLKNGLDDQVKQDVTTAFTNALSISSAIKAAVKKTSGQDVVNGLYLLDQAAMDEAMNSIPGMGQTMVNTQSQQGSDAAVNINAQFFSAILGGLGGNTAPLIKYLTKEMGDLKAQTAKSIVKEEFGTVIGLISLMPVLNVPITTFQYVFSSSEVSNWFVGLECASVKYVDYNYSYTVVEYNYKTK